MSPRLNMIQPSPALTEIIDAMWEWDVPEAAVARGITGKLLPSVAPQLAIHFRDPMWSDRVGTGGFYRQIACGVQTRVVTVRATGRVGAIALACATTTAQRAMLVEAFLLERLIDGSNAAILRAAELQRRSASILSVSELASRVNLSPRRFSEIFGIAPKRFARLLRLTRVLDLHRTRSTWTAIAHECGFADQAHLINDFRDLVQQAPEEFVKAAFSAKVRDVNLALGSGTLSNTFIL
jgi:AraC-like DNA-binding protein